MPVPATATKHAQLRYILKDPLGQGGMGVVYRAFDTEVKRDVALKTLQRSEDLSALEMFRKECAALASLNHPFIVDIYDIGELDVGGERRPFFVMPLLRGMTLDKLIYAPSSKLTIARVVEIVGQVCRGLDAAHGAKLIHRDLKPSNIFVLEGDTVKIIDFGVACMVDQRTTMAIKGTLYYMAPEQLEMKPVTPLSDIFSLGVVCYEALARRRPFEGVSREDIARAILMHLPPPVSDFNPAVNRTMSQVIHKAIAKKPWLRFQSARDFADALQKALRNEPIEIFDEARFRPRILRAKKAVEEGQYEFANEILTELEAESIDPEIGTIRRQLDQKLRMERIKQLLENARLRFQEEEYQLALQKVQEILQLDPENTDALALKGSIEEKRSERQVAQWLQLARQHLSNRNFSNAREALENVLQIKPKDTDAQRLKAEIDHNEREYLRIEQERRQLREAAREARQRGDISSAVSKMERVVDLDQLSPDIATPERNAEDQELFKQLRVEYDELKNAYAEARSYVEIHGNLEAAVAICDRYLERYPNDARFNALKIEVEERQRQQLHAYVAKVHQDVEQEQDLDRRVEVLREALARYPNEPHFEASLKSVTRQRDLAASIVARARSLEQQEQYTEALTQWETLRTIHHRYPGLEYEIERLKQRRELQGRMQARQRWVERIEQHLGIKEYDAALKTCREALTEFPDDGELGALLKLAQQGMERRADGQRLLNDGRQLLDAGKVNEGLQVLRQAYSLDEHNSAIRSALLETLLNQARLLVSENWRAAEDLIQQALEVDPSSALAKSLHTLTEDRKRSEIVQQCLTRAREHQVGEDYGKALGEVERGLLAYPDDTQLLRLQSTLKKSLTEAAQLDKRRRDLDRARELERQAKTVKDPSTAESLFGQTVEVTQLYPGDKDFEKVRDDMQQFIKTMTLETPAVEEPATHAPKPPPAKAEPPKKQAPPQGPGALAKFAAWLAGKWQLGSGLALPRWAALGACLFSVSLVGALIYNATRTKTPPPPPGAVKVTIAATPAGAGVLVDGKPAGQEIELQPGSHTIEASLPGYHPEKQTIEIPAGGGPQTVTLALKARPAVAQVVGVGLEKGQVFLDDNLSGELQDGQLALPNLPPGQHVLRLSGGGGEVKVTFEVKEGEAPLIASTPEAKATRAVAVSHFRGQGRLFASPAQGKAVLDGQEAGALAPGGLQLPQLPAGIHELTLEDGKTQSKFTLEIGDAPALLLHTTADRNAGDLLVVTGEAGVEIFINGKKQPRGTRGDGRIRIPNLEPKPLTVTVAKEGYRAEPAELSITITKGTTSKAEFKLMPIPAQPATLELSGLPPKTQVLIDGAVAGEAGGNGRLSFASVQPGPRRVEWRHPGFRPREENILFEAGKTRSLGGQDAAMELETGTIQFQVEPAGASLTISFDPRYIHSGRPPSTTQYTAVPQSLSLPVGTYNLTFRAEGHRDDTVSISLADRQTLPMKVRLTPLTKPPVVEKPKPGGMDEWENAKWTTADGWQVHRGGGLVTYGRQNTNGVFVFTIKPPGGGAFGIGKDPPVQWFCAMKDPGNYLLFRLDNKNLRVSEVAGGAEKPSAANEHGLDGKKEYELRVSIQPERVDVSVVEDGKSRGLVSRAGADLTRGKFGFRVGPNDQVRIKNFRFIPR